MTEDILDRAQGLLDFPGGEFDEEYGCDISNVIMELIVEVERLRSENKIISDRAAHHDRQDAAEIELLAARIKELEAVISEAFQELVTAGPDIGDIAAMSISLAVRKLASQNKRLEAAFLKLYVNQLVGCNMPREVAEKQACDALKRIKNESVPRK